MVVNYHFKTQMYGSRFLPILSIDSVYAANMCSYYYMLNLSWNTFALYRLISIGTN